MTAEERETGVPVPLSSHSLFPAVSQTIAATPPLLSVKIRAVLELRVLLALPMGLRNGSRKRPIGFPIDLQTVLGDLLRLSPSTDGSPDWSQE